VKPLTSIFFQWFSRDLPGETDSAGRINLKESAFSYTRVSGTVKLPRRGAPTFLYATGAATITDDDGNTVLELTSGRVGFVVPKPPELEPGWSGDVLHGDTTEIADIVDAADLQSRLDNDKENGILNRLKTGEILCTSPIDIDGDAVGCFLQGYGGVMAEAAADTRQFSALTRSGDFAGAPMVRYKRAYGEIGRFSYFGDTAANIDAGTYTDGELALLITRDTDVGTGKTVFYRPIFDAWETAVSIGAAAGEFNCDECLWFYPDFWRCDTAMVQYSEQSLGHHLIHPHYHLVDTCYEIRGGGDVKMDGGLFAAPRGTATDAALIRYLIPDATQYGLNAGGVTVNGIKIDAQARGVRLLDMQQASGEFDYLANVRFNSPQIPWDNSWSNDWTGPMFFVTGATHLIIDGATVLYPDAIRWHVSAGAYAKVTVINCSQCLVGTLYTDFLDIANSVGDLQVRFWNNSSSTGAEVSETLNGSSIPATVTVSAP
jgi:hypothetical protein